MWGLLGHRSGDNQQVVALCERLGWPFDLKQLRYGWASLVPNVLRGARPLGVAVEPGTPLRPPWPELVVAVGRRSAPVALHVRARSQGRSRLVQLGRPSAPLDWFDLVITTPQYRLPPRANVLEIPLPLARVPASGDPPVAGAIADLPRPHTAVLIGGPTAELTFGAAEARDLVACLERIVARQGGTLLMTTSPRTPSVVAREVRKCLGAPHFLHEWQSAAANPYASLLATADAVLVTGDSVSMIADACRTGVPVGVYRLPARRTLVRRAADAAYVRILARAGRHDVRSRVLFRLVDAGLVVSPRAHEAVHRILEQRRLITCLPGELPAVADAEQRQRAIAAWDRAALARVRMLFGNG